jgi:hypothetical protein
MPTGRTIWQAPEHLDIFQRALRGGGRDSNFLPE